MLNPAQQISEGERDRSEIAPAISLQNLAKSFGNFRAIDGVSLDIARGEVFGLLGPNGAGKTTTMRILSCLLQPTQGDAFVNGKSVRDPKLRVAISREIGLLTENPNLYERLTAEQNLVFFARAYNLPEDQIESRVSDVLERFDLASRRKDRVVAFSKGMKQKLAIARVLLHEPSILLLDEPTASLDAESAKAIRQQISETARAGHHTVLLSTHNLDDASRLCNRIAILRRGRILAVGTEDQILSDVRMSEKNVGSIWEPRVEIKLIDVDQMDFGFLKSAVPSIAEVNPIAGGIVITFDTDLRAVDIDKMTAKTVDSLVGHGAMVTRVLQKKPSLEELYLEIVAESKTLMEN
ncbi:MAG: ABC transporter ATP-binding protein [Nitrososphaerales archaeon]